jgi:hypothetical protein
MEEEVSMARDVRPGRHGVLGGRRVSAASAREHVAGAAEGLWKEVDVFGNVRYLLIEPDGQLWGIPKILRSLQFPKNLDAIKGTVAAPERRVSGVYRDVVGRAPAFTYTRSVSGLAGAVDLELVGLKFLGGVPLPDWSYTGTRDASYSVPASLAQISGTWSMEAVLPANFSVMGALTIDGAGAMTVANIGGCTFAGTIEPVSGKGYFRIRLAAVGGICASELTSGQVVGVAYHTLIPRRPPTLHVMWHNPSLSHYFWASGLR